MTDPARCPYCNQPLVNDDAVNHLHEAEEKLRRRLTKEANAEAKVKIEKAREAAAKKVRADAERERSKRERGLMRTIEIQQKQNEDLERRLAGLTAADQGDMSEADIADDLATAFPDDVVTREGKGGDILQDVRYRRDHELESAGTILYECKDRKNWSNAFITQIKKDGKARRTPYLLLVSKALPAKESGTCVREDVIVADPVHARHLARILRRMVIETHRAELAGKDRAGKTARLYEYLRGDEFREELAALVDAGSELAKMLQAERKDHERGWNKRQHAYDELLHNSIAIEDAIQSIIEKEGPDEEQAAATRRTAPRAGARRGARHASHV
jgi:hypothetical protein